MSDGRDAVVGARVRRASAATGTAMGATAPMGATAGAARAIRMREVLKRFGAVVANRDASLEVPTGEIHALVGENGAGKSTLMRVLSGMYAPDAGTVEVDGRDVTGWSTAEAIAAGVGMVHQHFMLVPTLTVAENVVLGREPRRGLRFDRAAAEGAVRELGERTGLRVAPERLVSQLSVGEAQRVEILKTLYRGARILVLDEPTAVLSPLEVDELWRVLRRLRDEGGTVVLITHKLDEVVAVSDAITVMRAGTTVERIRTADTTPAAIARAMVGRDVSLALDYVTAGGGGGGDGAEGGTAGPTGAATGERVRPPVSGGRGRQTVESAAQASRGAAPDNTIGLPAARREGEVVPDTGPAPEGAASRAAEADAGGPPPTETLPPESPARGTGSPPAPSDRAASGGDAGGAPPTGTFASTDDASTTAATPPPSARRTSAAVGPGDPADDPDAALRVRGLVVSAANGQRVVDDVSFAVRPGEILGIAGVEGNGQTALIEALAGLAPADAGRIELRDQGGVLRDITRLGVRERSDAGLSHIPEDRHHRGLVLEFPVADNLILGRQHHFTRGPALDRGRVAEHARAQIAAFDIRPPTADLPARALSGGNQQKIVVAREMGRDFAVLLAAQPTRGVDVGAIEFIHDQLRAAAAEGKAVLLVSADLAEVLALSDRVAVMFRGRLATVLPRAQASPDVLGPYMTGAANGAGRDDSGGAA